MISDVIVDTIFSDPPRHQIKPIIKPFAPPSTWYFDRDDSAINLYPHGPNDIVIDIIFLLTKTLVAPLDRGKSAGERALKSRDI